MWNIFRTFCQRKQDGKEVDFLSGKSENNPPHPPFFHFEALIMIYNLKTIIYDSIMSFNNCIDCDKTVKKPFVRCYSCYEESSNKCSKCDKLVKKPYTRCYGCYEASSNKCLECKKPVKKPYKVCYSCRFGEEEGNCGLCTGTPGLMYGGEDIYIPCPGCNNGNCSE